MLDTVDVLSHFALGVLAERKQVAPCAQPALQSKHNPALALAGHFPHLPRPTDNWPPEGKVLVRRLGPNEGTKLGTGKRSETRGAITAFLSTHQGARTRDIDAAIGKCASNVLTSMLRLGAVRRERSHHKYTWFLVKP